MNIWEKKIAAYVENFTQHTSAMCGQNAEFLRVEADVLND